MFIRQCFRTTSGKRRAYWALVESYRTERGPRQRVVAWLGSLDEQGRLGVQHAAEGRREDSQQRTLFEETPPRWVKVDASAVRVENTRQFGGPWLACELIRRLRLDEFLRRVMPRGQEQVPWALTSLVLVIARLCEPSSELHIAEQWSAKTALPELLGVPAARVDDNRLYRALDQLLPHKAELEKHLKERLGELFDLEYDLLLYDVTSTFFEGEAASNPLAQRGYSRDQRPDCKQVCIALVVSRCGMPLGYEVFAGNTADVTTVETIVTTMEARYGRSQRVWVMDRGMVSEKNIEFLKQGDRRYILGTPKSLLKKFEAELLKSDWHAIQAGVEVKLCAAPDGSSETFLLCRSRDRAEKDLAIVRRFEQRLEARLTAMTTRCQKQRRDPLTVSREVGRLLGQNTRAARLFDVRVETAENGAAKLTWQKIPATRDWATLSAGCYLLRSNVSDWSDEDLWRAYMQLTQAEAAFRIHKSDLELRPVWHQKQDRVLAHILVCFLAFVLWKTLAALCRRAGLGDEPRRVLSELSDLRVVDVILPTADGIELRKRCLSRPSEHQAILLHALGLELPSHISQTHM
ncbi:MAG TPA: IS1634 family transposase [Planctomycetaceae bacterium]|nr:IS1634 family transposase [Planctomycetaceae bacterium]